MALASALNLLFKLIYCWLMLWSKWFTYFYLVCFFCQVRVKAICVLEAILRKKDDEHFGIMASYFNENKDVVVKCSESPQASLREKANKVRFSKMNTLQFLALLELLQWRKQIHLNINAKIYVYKKERVYYMCTWILQGSWHKVL